MTRYTPQWLQAGSYAASQDRRLIAALWPGPASTGCAVSATGGAMNVQIQPGAVAVPTQNNTGSTLCSSNAVEQITIPPTPTTPNNQIDLMIVRPHGNDLDGGSNTDFIFDSIQGVAAATPVAPTVPAGTVALASISIPGGTANLATATFTDLRPSGLAVPGAGALPPPVTTGTTTQNFTDGSGVVWVARNGVNGGNWRRARDVLHAKWFRNAPLPLAVAGTNLAFDTMVFDPYGLWAGGAFTPPVAGVWDLRALLGFTATAASQWASVRAILGGATISNSQMWMPVAGNSYVPMFTHKLLAAGAAVTLNGYTSAAINAVVGGEHVTYGEFSYKGTG